jgi:hypothetical protein
MFTNYIRKCVNPMFTSCISKYLKYYMSKCLHTCGMYLMVFVSSVHHNFPSALYLMLYHTWDLPCFVVTTLPLQTTLYTPSIQLGYNTHCIIIIYLSKVHAHKLVYDLYKVIVCKWSPAILFYI